MLTNATMMATEIAYELNFKDNSYFNRFATFIAWWVLVGFSLHDNRLFYWIAVNAVFLIGMQPVPDARSQDDMAGLLCSVQQRLADDAGIETRADQ